jgi:hypothetical protein
MTNAQNDSLGSEENRQHSRRPVRLDAKLSCMKSGLRGYSEQPAMVLNISEGGCMVSCSDTESLPDHLHISILGLPSRVACAVVGRTAIRLNLQFVEMLAPAAVDRLSLRGV